MRQSIASLTRLDQPASLTPAQRAQIRTVDLDNPPPFVCVGDHRLAHEIGNLPTPGISHWLLRHDWGQAAGIFNRGLQIGADQPKANPKRIVAQLHSIDGDIFRDPQFEERAAIRDDLRSDLTDLFLDSATKLCARVLKQADYTTATLRLHLEHPGRIIRGRGNWHVDGNPDARAFRLLLTTEQQGLYIPDLSALMQTAFDPAQTKDLMTGADAYPRDFIDAGLGVYTHPPGIAVVTRGLGLRNLGPLSWHADGLLPDDGRIVRPVFIADFVQASPLSKAPRP